jgi:transcriptional regulator GlxA family with amidase domain
MQLGRAVTFIEAHLGERLALPVIAKAAGLSTRSLVRLFRKEVGTSVVEFILRRRIARARDLLRRTDHSCAEIAFESGFGSVQHFNRIFRRHQNLSPARWRQRRLDSTSHTPGTQAGGGFPLELPKPGDVLPLRVRLDDGIPRSP